MTAFRAPFCKKDVPELSHAIEVRPLGRHHPRALPYRVGRLEESTGPYIDGCLLNTAFTAVANQIEHFPGEVAGAVVVPAQIGIDPRRFTDEDRLAPGPGRVRRRHQQLAATRIADVGRDQPETPAVVT